MLPGIGTKPLQQLTPLTLNAMYARLQAEGSGHGPLSAKTVRYIHATIHKVLADAVDAGVLARNVADRAKAASSFPAINAPGWLLGTPRARRIPRLCRRVTARSRLAACGDDRYASWRDPRASVGRY